MIFTDIQSSTQLWGSVPEIMAPALEAHHRLVRQVIARHKCYEVKPGALPVGWDYLSLISLAPALSSPPPTSAAGHASLNASVNLALLFQQIATGVSLDPTPVLPNMALLKLPPQAVQVNFGQANGGHEGWWGQIISIMS